MMQIVVLIPQYPVCFYIAVERLINEEHFVCIEDSLLFILEAESILSFVRLPCPHYDVWPAFASCFQNFVPTYVLFRR